MRRIHQRTVTRREALERSNVEAAAIIAADPERYAGLPLEWAKRILAADAPLLGEELEEVADAA